MKCINEGKKLEPNIILQLFLYIPQATSYIVGLQLIRDTLILIKIK